MPVPTIPPRWDGAAANAAAALLNDYELRKWESPSSYIIQKTGANYEAVDGATKKVYSDDTTDATDPVQDAVDALVAGGAGGRIFFRKGTYPIDKLDVGAGYGLWLIGEDPFYTKIQSNTDGAYLIKLDDARINMGHEKLEFDGNGQKSTVLDYSRVGVTGSRPTFFTDCRIKGAKNEADSKLLDITRREEVITRNCYFVGGGTARHGIYFPESSGFVMLDARTVLDTCVDDCVYIGTGSMLLANNSEFHAQVGAGGCKIRLVGSATAYVQAYLTNCWFESTTTPAVVGVTNTFKPQLFMSNCFVYGQVTGDFLRIGIQNSTFAAPAGLPNFDINTVSHSIYGNGSFPNGINIVDKLVPYYLYDYETQAPLTNLKAYGTENFAGGVGEIDVSLPVEMPSTLYRILLGGNGDTQIYTWNKTATGFKLSINPIIDIAVYWEAIHPGAP